MANLFDYLDWRGDISFESDPPNQIDMLLLSHLTYSIFDGIISSKFKEATTFSAFSRCFKLAPDFEKRINIGYLINKRTTELMFKCAKSKRFKDVKLCGYRNIFDENNMEQFAAITYLIGNKAVVSFRGTDDTIAGWNEDFNIAYMKIIPSQKDAVEYFEDVAKELPYEFTLIGHSKGGNLAINTAVKCRSGIRNRIESIYNFDGPGFDKNYFNLPEYKAVENKINSFYPEFSLVGMVFNHPEKFTIVKSDGFAAWQHDSVTWQILGKEFVTCKEFTEQSKFFHRSFNQWIDRLSDSQREKFVKALFELIAASGVKTNTDLEKNALPASAKMISAFANMDKETKREIKAILGVFKEVVHEDFPLFRLFQ